MLPERAAVGAEQLARRARERAVRQPLAGRVHARVGERLPTAARRARASAAGAVQRLGRQRVLVLEPVRADGFEPARIAPGPCALPRVEELVHLHPRKDDGAAPQRTSGTCSLGQSLSTLGDRIVFVALALYVTEIGTPTDVGLVLAAHAVAARRPASCSAASWADRMPRARVMIASDLARCALHAAARGADLHRRRRDHQVEASGT